LTAAYPASIIPHDSRAPVFQRFLPPRADKSFEEVLREIAFPN
jgi:hypothetical protein